MHHRLWKSLLLALAIFLLFVRADDGPDDGDGDDDGDGLQSSNPPLDSGKASGSNSDSDSGIVLRPAANGTSIDGNWVIGKGLSTCNQSTLSAQTSVVGAQIIFQLPPSVLTASIQGFASGGPSSVLVNVNNTTQTADTDDDDTLSSSDGCNILFIINFGPDDIGKGHVLTITNQGTNTTTSPNKGPGPPGPPAPATTTTSGSLTINSVILGMVKSNSTTNPAATISSSGAATSSTSSSLSNPSANPGIASGNTAGDSNSNSDSGLSPGAIAGIVLACVFSIFLLLVAFVLYRRHQNQKVSLENGIWSKQYFKNEDTMRYGFPSPTAQLGFRASTVAGASGFMDPSGGDRYRASQFEILTGAGIPLAGSSNVNPNPFEDSNRLPTIVTFPPPSRSVSVKSKSSSISSHRKPVPSMIGSGTDFDQSRRTTMSNFFDDSSSTGLVDQKSRSSAALSESSFESPGSMQRAQPYSTKASSYLLYPDPPRAPLP